jgi:lipopolysaccharide/colanic/teichoic acid biosynthesis glycosyltransferase
LLDQATNRPRPLGGRAKRATDLALAVPLAVATAPLMAGIALWVRRDSPGPALYRQRRVGYAGAPFTLLKFRTMVVGAETMGAGLAVADGDERITRAGRALRRLSLDELPQLWNVIRGDMSLVGPRPPLPEEVTQYEDWHFDRLEAPPGITGLWQISGRSELSFDDCVRLDVFYIENWSLAYDLYILAKTVPVLLRHRGAY